MQSGIINHIDWLNENEGEQLDLIEQNIKEYKFESIDLNSALFTEVYFTKVHFNKVNLSGSYFSGCTFENLSIEDCNFRKCEFHDCKFIDCKIINSDITKSEFFDLNMVNSIFKSIDLGWTYFDSSYFKKVVF